MSAFEAAFALRRELNARATGLWHVEGDALVLDVFAPAEDMPADVAKGFSQATQRVPLSLRDLGVVRAALERQVVVSRAAELPPEVGSGYWLRAFGAERSVAVPLNEGRSVFSAAVPHSCRLDDESIAQTVRRFGATVAGS
jgi:hypothetical protein